MARIDDLNRLYGILHGLREGVGGSRCLRDCTGRSGWPQRGVYFFFESGEFRDDGRTWRVTRVGTHAISANSTTTLWGRLQTHRGHMGGTGNHRGSIFRKRVGEALMTTGEYPDEFRRRWSVGYSAPKAVRLADANLRASHLKPWRDASNEERLDGENGLLLTPSIDPLLDEGFNEFPGVLETDGVGVALGPPEIPAPDLLPVRLVLVHPPVGRMRGMKGPFNS